MIADVVAVTEDMYDTAGRREALAGYLKERGHEAGLEVGTLAEAMVARVVADIATRVAPPARPFSG